MEEVRKEGSRVNLLAQGGRKEGGQQGKPAGARREEGGRAAGKNRLVQAGEMRREG